MYLRYPGVLLLISLLLVSAGCTPGLDAAPLPVEAEAIEPLVDCSAPVSAPPAELGLDPFYEKYVYGGIPIVSSAEVSDDAFPVACNIVHNMLAGRPDIAAELRRHNIRVGIMAWSEVTTDMPEHRDLNEAFPSVDWNERARGLGATLERPLVTCGEDNLLGFKSDWYAGEFILVHEFAHTMWLGVELLPDGDAMKAEIERAYAAAIAAGTFRDTYAATNSLEYWAEGVQAWFDTNHEANPADGIHNSINSRSEIKIADPALAQLIRAVYPDGAWRPGVHPAITSAE